MPGQHMFACSSPPLLTSRAGAYNIETTGIQNSCDVGAQVRVAVYGIFAIFLVSAVVEMSIASVGLKGLCVFRMRPGCFERGGTATNQRACPPPTGGPLEVKKRAAMHPLLYIENFLWLMLLGWTGKGAGDWARVGRGLRTSGEGDDQSSGDVDAGAH